MNNKCFVGGQAVIEGVMMRGNKGMATAIRKSNGEIVINKKTFTPYTKKYKILNIPIIRGFISLIESLAIGIDTLNYSASFFEEDKKPSKFEKWMENKFKGNLNILISIITVFISFVISICLFLAIPTILANAFKNIGIKHSIVLNILEGIIRVTIFLTYLYAIGKMNNINRLFQYHGAEHKTIFCYENDVELTPENAQRFSRFHPRCGTNFLFLVMIVSIILFSFTGWSSLLKRLLYRIILLPAVSGITYEVIRWLGKSSSNLSKIISYPGLALQKLTTREPDLSQLEVAIKALKVSEGIYEDNLNEDYNKEV